MVFSKESTILIISAITYKLKWNGGDMKSVQGDSGHARMDMITNVYSHIIDEERMKNAQNFDEQFYHAKALPKMKGKTVSVPTFAALSDKSDPIEIANKEPEKDVVKSNKEENNIEWVTKLLENPETMALLKALAKKL